MKAKIWNTKTKFKWDKEKNGRLNQMTSIISLNINE